MRSSITRNGWVILILGLLLFMSSFLVIRNSSDGYVCAANTPKHCPILNGLYVMPPTAHSFKDYGFPMHAISLTKDEDSNNTLYRDYSVVAILVNLITAMAVSIIFVLAYRKIRKVPSN
jgi:hypothetical protein